MITHLKIIKRTFIRSLLHFTTVFVISTERLVFHNYYGEKLPALKYFINNEKCIKILSINTNTHI